MLNMTLLISTKAMLAFLFIVLIFAILAFIFIRPHDFPKSRIVVFFSLMAAFAVLLVGLNLLTQTFTLEQQTVSDKTAFTKQAIDKLWLYPNQVLINSTRARAEFLKSFYYNNPHLFRIPSSSEQQTIAAVLEEQNIAIIFIQSWEDFLTMRVFDQTGDQVWLHNFLQWAQSPYLKEYFNILKYNFKDTTIELGNLLFEYAKTLPIPTYDPEQYKFTVQQMLKDPRTIDLFERSLG